MWCLVTLALGFTQLLIYQRLYGGLRWWQAWVGGALVVQAGMAALLPAQGLGLGEALAMWIVASVVGGLMWSGLVITQLADVVSWLWEDVTEVVGVNSDLKHDLVLLRAEGLSQQEIQRTLHRRWFVSAATVQALVRRAA